MALERGRAERTDGRTRTVRHQGNARTRQQSGHHGNGKVMVMITPPLPSAVQSSATGRESAVNGKTITGVVNAGSSSMSFVNYDNSYPGVNNGVYSIFGSYQV